MNQHTITFLIIYMVGTACSGAGSKRIETTDSVITISTDTHAVDTVIAKTSELGYLRNTVGKIPYDVQLFKHDVLSKRLRNLLGKEYETMMNNWNVETSITIENDIIHTSGCKKHDCTADSYDLFIDLKNDNINIYNLRGSSWTTYKEKEQIPLAGEMAKEMSVKKKNANSASIENN